MSNDEVPYVIPIKELSDQQVAAIERFYAEYSRDSRALPGAIALVAGFCNSTGVGRSARSIASVDGKKFPKKLTLYGRTIPFDNAYRTSTKHTYYSGIHAAGYRLTLGYHDASGGGYVRLKVKREEDV